MCFKQKMLNMSFVVVVVSLTKNDVLFYFSFYVTHVFEVSEGDKLDDVSEDRLSFGRSQDPVVSIQHLHVAEISVPDPNNNDGHGQVGGLDNGLSRVGHVGDHTVRQDQQDEVLLMKEYQEEKGQTFLISSLFPFCVTVNVELQLLLRTTLFFLDFKPRCRSVL